MIYVNTSQTVYYGIGGQAPNRTAIFEFYESHIGAPSEYYHFQVIFYENAPGIVKYIYFETTDGGVSATVGVQGEFFDRIENDCSWKSLFSLSRIRDWSSDYIFCRSSKCTNRQLDINIQYLYWYLYRLN